MALPIAGFLLFRPVIFEMECLSMPSNISERLLAMQPLWGTWYVEDFIGEGSYGTVYRIRRREQAFDIEQDCALKWIALPQRDGDLLRLRSENMSDEDIRDYYEGLIHTLKHEILLMSSLSGNSHIVNYADHLIVERSREIGWDILIRMEYLTPLDKYILNAPFTERDVARMGVDICDALMLCAQRKILHRDVKPDNIFISRDGNFKLGDFGVSRTMEKTVSHLSIKGAPMYMAPEIYMHRDVDFSADTYSLGLVLYRLLNRNRMPFLPLNELPTHADREEALRRRLQGDILPAPVNGCREMKRIMLKACAYKREQRFTSAEEMKESLETLLKRDKLSTKNLLAETPRSNPIASERSPLRPFTTPNGTLDPIPQAESPAMGGQSHHDPHQDTFGETIGLQFRQESASEDNLRQHQTASSDGIGQTIGLSFDAEPASEGRISVPPFDPEAAVEGEAVNQPFEPGAQAKLGSQVQPGPGNTRKASGVVERQGSEISNSNILKAAATGSRKQQGLRGIVRIMKGESTHGFAPWLIGIAAVLIVLAVALYAAKVPEKLMSSAFNGSGIINTEGTIASDVLGSWSVRSGDVQMLMKLDAAGRLYIRSIIDGSNEVAVDFTGSYSWQDQKLYLTINNATTLARFSKNPDTLTVNLSGKEVEFHRL